MQTHYKKRQVAAKRNNNRASRMWRYFLSALALVAINSDEIVQAFTGQTATRVRSRPAEILTLPYQVDDKIDTKQHKDTNTILLNKDYLRKKYSESFSFGGEKSKINPDDLQIGKEVEGTLPLILHPASADQQSTAHLQAFMQNNREWIENKLLEHGAIMFRGFDLETAKDVEDSIMSFNPNLNNQYRGTSPRNVQDGTDYVFSAAEVPSHFPIAQHIEMSFLPAPPKQLYFSALQAPQTAKGGETALADFRKVYQDLPQKLRNKLASKKLRYRRTHHKFVENTNTNTHDVAAMQSWPQVFGTTNKVKVERLSKQESNLPVRWEGPNNDVFVSEFISEPFQRHPQTNEMVWFNHAQVFHWTSFPAELFAAFRRTKDWRFLNDALGVGVKSIWKYGILRNKMALHVSFGDGTPISIWEMHQIRKAIHKNMVYNRWQQGDLLLIDNFSTSHGRQPTYDQGRKIVVAWSDPIQKQTL